MNVVAIIQARMGSTRLPGKALSDIFGKPMLQRVVERVGAAQRVGKVAVAIAHEDGDNQLARFCHASGFNWCSFRSIPASDVLTRYIRAAEAYDADIIVRITSDCPLLDPGLIDEAIENLIEFNVDYVTNAGVPGGKRGYPDGLDVEVFRRHHLARLDREASSVEEREHVTIASHSMMRTRVLYLWPPWGELSGECRWTVDTEADRVFVDGVYRAMHPRDIFGWRDVFMTMGAQAWRIR